MTPKMYGLVAGFFRSVRDAVLRPREMADIEAPARL